MKKQKCIILIDGSNFYFKLKDLGLHNLLTFDFTKNTDLAPAIKKAREKGKIVEYVGFSHKPSVAMVSFCSESQLLTKEDLSNFLKDKTSHTPI